MRLFARRSARSRLLHIGDLDRQPVRLCLYALAWLVVAAPSPPDIRRDPDLHLSKISQEAVKWLSEYVKINTANPPGRELRAAEYLGGLLAAEGIPFRNAISAPGRANLVARIKGTDPGGGLALVHHMDVAAADKAGWSAPPFSGLIRDGYVWGRGTVDSKGLGIVHLASFIAVKRSGVTPKRDLVFLVTCDEEMGGSAGMEWVIKHRPSWLQGVDYALTEGGSNIVQGGRLVHVGVETTQKLVLWLRIRAFGEEAHSAVPGKATASHRLVHALDRLLRYQPAIRITPEVSRYLRDIAPYQPPDVRDRLLHPEDLVEDILAVRRLAPVHQALLRDTIALTFVRAGRSTNILSETAYAELDCRLVPDQDPMEFLDKVNEIVNDENVLIEPFLVSSPASSPLQSKLFDAIRTATRLFEPQATVGGSVLAGFSDARFLREKGIICYGFDPFKGEDRSPGVHGTDERISVSDLEFAIRYCHAVVSEMVETQKPEARSQKPEAGTRSQEPGARSQKSEARSQKPGTRSQEPEVRSQEPEARREGSS